MRESKIQYNPSLTVKENAKCNGVTEAAIRYYIKVNHLDRRFDRKQNIIDDCRKYLKKHPSATKTELHKKTGHSLSTIYQYWEYISTEKEFVLSHQKTKYNTKKNKFRCPSVYLMKETNGKYIKIGKSVTPLNREKTLWSEKPNIELFLICTCEDELSAGHLEKELHQLFRHKRVRGEWFELNNEDINLVKEKYQWITPEQFKISFEINSNESFVCLNKIRACRGIEYETMSLCDTVKKQIRNGNIQSEQLEKIKKFLLECL